MLQLIELGDTLMHTSACTGKREYSLPLWSQDSFATNLHFLGTHGSISLKDHNSPFWRYNIITLTSLVELGEQEIRIKKLRAFFHREDSERVSINSPTNSCQSLIEDQEQAMMV